MFSLAFVVSSRRQGDAAAAAGFGGGVGRFHFVYPPYKTYKNETLLNIKDPRDERNPASKTFSLWRTHLQVFANRVRVAEHAVLYQPD
jgi:hypothetical protein